LKGIQLSISRFFPRTCILCGTSLLFNEISDCLCPECLDAVTHLSFASLYEMQSDGSSSKTIQGKICRICGQPLSSEIETCMRCRERSFAFEENRSCFLYEGGIKELIRQYKFNGRIECASFFATHTALICHTEYPGLPIIPVPGRRASVRKRGYDQVEAVCRILSRRYSIQWIRALMRKGSRAQKTLSYDERLINLKGKISVRKAALPLPKACILLDDVFTTGATAHECSLVLKKHGVKEVHMVSFAID